MKSAITITNNGKMMNPELCQEFVIKVLQDKGLKFTEHNDYELWRYPKTGTLICWYILKKSDTRREVIRQINPTFVGDYVDNWFNTINDRIINKKSEIQKKEEEIKELRHTIIKLETKKKIKTIKQDYNLEGYISKC